MRTCALAVCRMNTGLGPLAREPRAQAGKQYDAAARRPMPQKDVQHERENTFID
jgi:hypothetical protein